MWGCKPNFHNPQGLSTSERRLKGIHKYNVDRVTLNLNVIWTLSLLQTDHPNRPPTRIIRLEWQFFLYMSFRSWKFLLILVD